MVTDKRVGAIVLGDVGYWSIDYSSVVMFDIGVYRVIDYSSVDDVNRRLEWGIRNRVYEILGVMATGEIDLTPRI